MWISQGPRPYKGRNEIYERMQTETIFRNVLKVDLDLIEIRWLSVPHAFRGMYRNHPLQVNKKLHDVVSVRPHCGSGYSTTL